MPRLTFLVAWLLACPALARAAGPDLTLALQQAPPSASPGDLDFDLLGEPEPPRDAPDERALKRRRKLLTLHQGVGLGLYALQLGTTVVGQLSYRDKFATPANTGKWRLPHAALAFATTGVFALNGALAFAAPAPVKHTWRLDRATVHRVSMYTAAAGMIAQVALGVYTASREGHTNQRDLAKTHLYLGYGTLAAMTTGVAVLVF